MHQVQHYAWLSGQVNVINLPHFTLCVVASGMGPKKEGNVSVKSTISVSRIEKPYEGTGFPIQQLEPVYSTAVVRA